MTARNVASVAVLMLLLNTALFSQGAYLDRGTSGVGVGGSFSTNENLSGISGAASYSLSGVFDLGLSVGRFSFEQKLAGYDLSATAISPFVTVHAVKQDSITPISLALSASYESDSYSSDALSQLDVTMSGSYFSFGAAIYGNVYLSPTTKLQPSFGIAYVTGKSELKDNYGNTVSSDNDATVFEVAATAFFQSGPSTIFRIGPGLSFDKNNTTFYIGAGLVVVLPH